MMYLLKDILIIFLIFIILETIISLFLKKKVYNYSDTVANLQHGIVSIVINIPLNLAGISIYILVYNEYSAFSWPVANYFAWVVALFMWDFSYYWNHRLNHEVNFMWAAHVIHHSSENFNLTTALRQSSTMALQGWIFYLPMAVFGVPPIMFVTVGAINIFYQFFVHTQLVGKLGWCEMFMITPSNHRVHHGQNNYCIDKNYGGMFIIWDRLFGTFASERDDEKVCYGIRKPNHSFDPIWSNLHYYADLWQEAKLTKGWRAKMHIWLSPPGGWNSQPIETLDVQAFKPFVPAIANQTKLYVGGQLIFVISMLLHFEAIRASQVVAWTLAYALLIVVSCVTSCALLLDRRWARSIEQARLSCIAFAILFLSTWFGYSLTSQQKFAALIVLGGALFWVSYSIPHKVNSKPIGGQSR